MTDLPCLYTVSIHLTSVMSFYTYCRSYPIFLCPQTVLIDAADILKGVEEGCSLFLQSYTSISWLSDGLTVHANEIVSRGLDGCIALY